MPRIASSAWFLLLVACGDSTAPKSPPAEPAAPKELLNSDVVHEVSIELDPSDWNTIRSEGRSINTLYSGCLDPAFEYTWVDAELRLGERNLGKVRLRKKGFFGSLSANRPSLRADVAEYSPEQRVFGSKNLVLNNSRQDPSFVHQCMAYAAFKAAGVPAPRCGFAHVRVNGEDLGSYVIVEPIKKPFLKRELGDDEGILLEGNGGADFTSERLDRFDIESGDATDASDVLAPLTAAIATSDQDLPGRLRGVLDLPAFLRFWAVESLIGHWDGYSGDLNNFYVYAPAGAGPIQFIPWGTDATYTTTHSYLPQQGRPQSVYAVGRLANRLYALQETREQYRSTLRDLLRDAWDERAMQRELDRMESLVADIDPAALEATRDFIRTRRSQLQPELEGQAPPWPYPERAPPACREAANSDIHATFDAVWKGLDAVEVSPGNSLDLLIDDKRTTYPLVFASAGIADTGKPTVQLLGQEAGGTYIVLSLQIGARPLHEGEIRFHGAETLGIVLRAPNRDSYQMIGYVGEGAITFDEVGTTAGARLRGRVDGRLLTLNPELANLMSKR